MPDSSRTQIATGSLVCLIGVVLIYGLTLAPTVQGFDSAELTVGAYTLGLVHPTGYPLYMLIGHVAAQLPWSDVGFRLNLLSAFLGTTSVVLFYILLSAQTKSALTSLTAALLFALAPHVWVQSIKAEVYTLHVLLVAGILWLWWIAEQRELPVLALVYFALLGLASTNHATSIILGLGLLVSTKWRDPHWRRYSILGIGLGACLALSLYLYFPWRAGEPSAINYIREYFHRDPRHPEDLLWLISGQAFRCAVLPSWTLQGLIAQVSRLATFIWDGSLGLAPLLAIWGWKLLQTTHQRWNRLLTVFFGGNVIFFLIYQVVDKEAMFLPIYLVMDLWIAQGILGFTRWLPTRLSRLSSSRSILFTNLLFLGILGIGAILDWNAIDLRQDRQVHDFATQLLRELPTRTIIVNHWATASVFDYLRIVEKLRPDVSSFNLDFFFLGVQATCQADTAEAAKAAWFDWLGEQTRQKSPLCFIEPLPAIPQTYQLVRQGGCWRMIASP